MKKRDKMTVLSRQFVDFEIGQQNDYAISILKSAWKNLPMDMSHNEREIFLDIVENLIKFHQEDKLDNNRIN